MEARGGMSKKKNCSMAVKDGSGKHTSAQLPSDRGNKDEPREAWNSWWLTFRAPGWDFCTIFSNKKNPLKEKKKRSTGRTKYLGRCSHDSVTETERKRERSPAWNQLLNGAQMKHESSRWCQGWEINTLRNIIQSLPSLGNDLPSKK